jgi:hypothetical protein
MHRLKNFSKRSTYFLVAWLLSLSVALPVLLVPSDTSAAQLTSRKIALSSSANGNISTDVAGNAVSPGDGGNGAKAEHIATFTMASSNATVGSMLIMYCTSPIFTATCTTPTGFDAASLTAATVSGLTGAGGFSLDTATTNAAINAAIPAGTGVCNGSGTTRTNCVAVRHGSGQAQTGTPTGVITYGGGAADFIKNPTTDDYAFYARIIVFSDIAYATQVDYGGVAMSTAQQIDITAKVQEVLNFSVGATHVAPGGSCTALSDSGAVALGDVNGVLSLTTQYDAYSYFRVNTNTLNGTVIQYSGDTLESGANSITALSSEVVTAAGTESFGLSFDSASGNYSLTNLTRAAGYDEGNGALGTAKFNYSTASVGTPVQIASSTGAIICDTGAIRYVGNIDTTTPAGIYTTTVTYIAIGTY